MPERILRGESIEPDPEWRFVDAAGHAHHAEPGPPGGQLGPDVLYPTLRVERIITPCPEPANCPGGGFDHVEYAYTCPLCGEAVVPGEVTVPYEIRVDVADEAARHAKLAARLRDAAND